MFRIFGIVISVILMAGFVVMQIGTTENSMLMAADIDSQNIDVPEAVQIGDVWVPVEPLMLKFMQEVHRSNSREPTKIGNVWIP